ncbi:MAG: hypothetical protein ABIS50_04585 [Luteolibacter sp.]|uniref:hypothetical protein n=1 Tax=Luteolibacter sp. TaxID=1962973 RepID=UPI003262E76B
MKYRPSKSFVYLMVTFCPLLVALFFGLLPEVPGFEARPIPGEITFSNQKPTFKATTQVSTHRSAPIHLSDWFEESYENLMRWEYNPWKTDHSDEFGEHFRKLLKSSNPADIAQGKEMQRRMDAFHQKLLLRYPEMAVTMKAIPDDQNGFLKWLEFSERLKKSSGLDSPNLGIPQDLVHYLNDGGPWNAEVARAWLSQQKSLVDEIRAIGLMPDSSVNDVAVDRWAFTSARLAKQSAECLMTEARLYAEEGNAAAAMESIRAAKGFSDHFTEVETPTLLAATVRILIQLELENRVLTEIMPALPAGQVDPTAWESVLNPTVSQPSEFTRYMKGVWSATTRQYLLPMLFDPEDSYQLPDGGDMLDAYSSLFVETVRTHEGAALTDLPTLNMPSDPDVSQLSLRSRKILEVLSVGGGAWRKGWDRSQSATVMTQAAFAIMEGQPIPRDPVYGKDYQWDPATRQLSMPAGKEFEGMTIKPITVPKL